MGIYTSMQLPFLKKSFVDMSQKLLKRKYDIFPSFNAQFFFISRPCSKYFALRSSPILSLKPCCYASSSIVLPVFS